MGGPTIGGMGRDAGGTGGTADNEEESADPIHPPVSVEVQGIIYIYNPPPVQEPGKAEGDNGQTAPAAGKRHPSPSGTSPAPERRGQPGPERRGDDFRRRQPVGANPAPSGAATAPAVPTNPQTIPSGGRP